MRPPRRLPAITRACLRGNIRKALNAGQDPTFRTTPKILSSKLIDKLGVLVSINGETLRLYRLQDIASIFHVSYITATSWYDNGILPDPYMTRLERRCPLWTRRQINGIVKGIKAVRDTGRLGMSATYVPVIEYIHSISPLKPPPKQEVHIAGVEWIED